MAVSVLLADDHEVVRGGLVSIFEGTELEVVGEAENADEAVEKTLELSPDVVVLDIRMNGRDGLDALSDIVSKSPQTRVVMLTTYDNPTYVARSVALGAHDYLLKDSSSQELVDRIRRVAKGLDPPEHSLLMQARKAMANRKAGGEGEVQLTRRETQVLRHIALGLNNREIAQSLNISVETVKEHVQNVLRKTNLDDRTQAAVWAVRRKLA